MNKLTNYETKILDDYFLRNNVQDFSYAKFRIVINDTLPSWRSEQLAGDSVYTGQMSDAYIDYLENLINDSQV